MPHVFRPAPRSGWQSLSYAAASLLPSALVAVAGLLALARSAGWYDALTVPSFAPPGWSLGPMAALVDLVTACAFYRILCHPDWMPDRPGAIRAFLIQLGLNAVWPLAVAAHAPEIALFVIVALLAALIVTVRRFRRIDRVAGRWVMLGGAWIAFSTLVTLSIVIRN